MRNHPLITVTWLDAHGDAYWEDEENADAEPIKVFTVGWLIKGSKEAICVAASLSENKTRRFSDYTTIPRGCISKVEYLGKRIFHAPK